MAELPKSVLERLKSRSAQEHPDADLLTAFSENALRGDERERMLAHLAVCTECRDVVALAGSGQEDQPVTVVLPWYRRPQTFTWSAVAATLVVGAALVVNFKQSPDYSARQVGPSAQVPPSAPQPANAPAASVLLDTQASRESDQRAAVQQKPAELQKQSRDESLKSATSAGAKMQDNKKAIADGAANRDFYVAKKAVPAPADNNFTILGKPSSEVAAHKDEETKTKAAAPPSSQAPQVTAATVNVTGQQKEATDRVQAESVEIQSAPPSAAGASGVAGGTMKGNAPALKAQRARIVDRWTVDDKGQLQRSTDSGRTWVSVAPDEGVPLRAVAAVGSNVWAGGAGSALYYSSDSGQTWSPQVLPGSTAAIVSLRFTDGQHGTARCDDGTTWTTADGGQHWSKLP